MKAIIWKEFRENLRWMVLAMIVLLALFLGFWDHRSVGQSLAADWFLAATVLGFAILGLKMARFPKFGEIDPHRWQFLMHRPLLRTRMFIAHAGTGVVMYLLAGGVPLAATVWWAATPASVPGPFHWRMTLAPLADLIAGLMWYFAALLVVTRPARWLGSKMLPLALPLVAQALVTTASPTFTKAAIVFGITIALLALAAWGSYCTGPSEQSQPRRSKAALATSLLFGSGLAAFAVAAMLAGAIRILALGPYIYETYQIDRFGQVLRVTYREGVLSRVTDIEGKPVLPDFPADSAPDGEKLLQRRMDWALTELAWGKTIEDFSSRSFHASRHTIIPLEEAGGIKWYWVAPRKVVEGYDALSRSYVGAIGADGFVAAPKRPTPFDASTRPSGGSCFLIGTHSAYALDLNARTAAKLMTARDDEQVISARTLRGTEGQPGPSWRFIATTQNIYVFPPEQPMFQVPNDQKNWMAYEMRIGCVSAAPARVILWSLPSRRFNERLDETPQHVVEYSVAGQRLRAYDLPVLPDTDAQRDRPFGTMIAASIPLAGFELVKLGDWFLNEVPLGWGRLTPQTRTLLLLVVLIGVLCAAITWWWTARYAFSPCRRIAWSAGNVLLGIPGLLTLLSLHAWPARVPCGSCARPRVVTHDRCEHCDAAFAQPQLNGTEIFE